MPIISGHFPSSYLYSRRIFKLIEFRPSFYKCAIMLLFSWPLEMIFSEFRYTFPPAFWHNAQLRVYARGRRGAKRWKIRANKRTYKHRYRGIADLPRWYVFTRHFKLSQGSSHMVNERLTVLRRKESEMARSSTIDATRNACANAIVINR